MKMLIDKDWMTKQMQMDDAEDAATCPHGFLVGCPVCISDTSQEDRFEKNTWYWMTDPREGDVWWPIFINQNLNYLLDDQYRPIIELKGLDVRRAVMPT